MRTIYRIFLALGFFLSTFYVSAEPSVEDDNQVIGAANKLENYVPYAPESLALIEPLNPGSMTKTQRWSENYILSDPKLGLIKGPFVLTYNLGVAGLIETALESILSPLFPFLFSSSEPAWLTDLYDRLDEMEEHITSGITGFVMEDNFSKAKASINTGKGYHNGYMSKSIIGDTFFNEFNELEPTPVHRSRAEDSYDHIQDGLSALEVGLSELDRILLDYKDDPRYFGILSEIYSFMLTTLPYYVETGIESYQTYKWPKNAREAALQERYDDNLVQQWAFDVSNYVSSNYVRRFGGNGPGEPYNYSQSFTYPEDEMALTEKDY